MFQDVQEILTVLALAKLVAQTLELHVVDPPVAPADLLRAADTQPLPRLKRLHKLPGLQQRVEGSRIKPRTSPAEQLDIEVATLEIRLIYAGDLKLAARGRLESLMPR